MIYVLYNPFAGNKTCEEQSRKLTDLYKDEQLIFRSMTDISYPEFFAGLKGEDRVIICGGDGTLNRFVNDARKIDIHNDILYYAAGSGNDFLRDIGKEKGCAPFVINQYIKELPSSHRKREGNAVLKRDRFRNRRLLLRGRR